MDQSPGLSIPTRSAILHRSRSIQTLPAVSLTRCLAGIAAPSAIRRKSRLVLIHVELGFVRQVLSTNHLPQLGLTSAMPQLIRMALVDPNDLTRESLTLESSRSIKIRPKPSR